MKKRLCFLTALLMLATTACGTIDSEDSSNRMLQSSQNVTDSSESVTTTATTTSESTEKKTETSADSKRSERTTTVDNAGQVSHIRSASSGDYFYDADKYFESIKEMWKEKMSYAFEDSDDDGFPDEMEKRTGTDINNKDSDGDGIEDLQEMYVTATDPTKKDSDNNGTDDGSEDPDEDGLSNKQEVGKKTHPKMADTDHDGINDGDEVLKYKTNPTDPDTDKDGIRDGDELLIGTDVLNTSTNGKPDKDRLVSKTINENDPELEMMNNDSEVPYKVSLKFDVVDGKEGYLSVGTSRHMAVTEYYKDSIVGGGVDVSCSKKLYLNGEISFRIDKNYVDKNLTDNNDKTGYNKLRRLVICGVRKDYMGIVELDTVYDESTNTVSAKLGDFDDIALVDYKKYITREGKVYG